MAALKGQPTSDSSSYLISRPSYLTAQRYNLIQYKVQKIKKNKKIYFALCIVFFFTFVKSFTLCQ